MEKLQSFVLDYKGFGNCHSQCRIIYKFKFHPFTHTQEAFICFIDMGIGTSVTNYSEGIAGMVVRKLKLDPKHTRFFEAYLCDNNDSSFDEIVYDWDHEKLIPSNPKWNPGNIKIKEYLEL